MARIAVYVPDDRMSDVEKWREGMNFSQLFIDAFDRAIQTQSALFKLKDSEMKAVVQRLKKASERTYENGWKEGAKIGRQWATKHSHISHLRNIAEGRLTFEGVNVIDWLNCYYEHMGYCRTPEDERHEEELDRFSDVEVYHRARNAGFVEATTQVWEEVRAAFEANE